MSFSIVIPIFNEEKILKRQIATFLDSLERAGQKNFEIILAENGSTDKTFAIAEDLAKYDRRIRSFHLKQARFGSAFRAGAMKARHEYIFLMNADWLDASFIDRALPLLIEYDIVVGSKTKMLELDHRPIIRKIGSKILTTVLRKLFGYRGSDSHGLKAFRTRPLQAILKNCISDEIIESEIMLRADSADCRVTEIPVSVEEIRPARIGFLRRCFIVAREVAVLYLRARSIRHRPARAIPRLHADDAGLNEKVNAAISSLLKKEKLESFSIIANGPAVAQACKIARKNHQVPVFLHFNLVEGSPLSDQAKVRSLLSSFDVFHSAPLLISKLILGSVMRHQIEMELQAQFDRLRKAGVNVAGIDSHQHIHAFEPVASIVEEFAKRNKLRFMRSYKQMHTFTSVGWLKKKIVKTMARLTVLRYFGRPSLPVSWKDSFWENFAVASWEDIKKADMSAELIFVCHPGSTYDRTFDFRRATVK